MKKRTPIAWISRRIQKRKGALAVMTATHICSAFLGVLFALGTRWIIDSAQAGNSRQFTYACVAQGALILALLGSHTLDRHLREKLTAQIDRDLKAHFLHRLLNGDYQTVSAYHTGELLNRLNNDVRIVTGNTVSLLPGVAGMATKLIGAIAFLAVLEPMLTLWVVLAGVVVVVATGFLRRRLKGLHKEVAIAEGKSSGFMQETLEKLLFVQAMDISEEVERRADNLLDNRYDLQRKRKNISVMTGTCMSILSYGAAFASLIWCANGLLSGTMTFGTLTAVSQLVGQLRTPFVNISAIMPQYVALCAAAERLMELETVGKRPKARTDGEEVYEKMEGVQAKNLSFGYDRERIFDNASFFLPKNTFGVVAGQSGIGKSTLLKLLLGVLHPDNGNLVFRSGNAETPVDATTRSLFAYVPQGNLLLSGTIRENLCITRPNATEEEINQAVFVSGMDAFLPALPLGLDTVLGESGAGLSEGQAQRLSIARAILSQAPILLLDEATSALDAETEKLVLQRLKELPNKTCIAVTHKQAPMEQCDWILEVGEGSYSLKEKR